MIPTIAYLLTFGNQKSGHFLVITLPSPSVNQISLSNPGGSLDVENLGKRKIEADQSYTTLCTEIHESFIHTVRINKGNFFSICREKTWKNTDSSLTCKHYFENSAQYLPAEILENRNVPIFGGFESQKSGLAR